MDYKISEGVKFIPIHVEFDIASLEDLETWVTFLGALSGKASKLTYSLYDKLDDMFEKRIKNERE